MPSHPFCFRAHVPSGSDQNGECAKSVVASRFQQMDHYKSSILTRSLKEVNETKMTNRLDTISAQSREYFNVGA